MKLSRLITLVVAGLGLFALLPACSQTANVTDVFMSIDSDGARRRNVFFTDTEEIYCLTEYGNGRDDVTLEIILRARKLYVPETGGTVDVNRVIAYSEQKPSKTNGQPGISALQFVPAGPDGETEAGVPFPAGEFQCEVYLDGEEKGRAAFVVQHPPCPTRAIFPNQVCGYYQFGRVCPSSGNNGNAEPTCTCINGVWQC